MDLHCDVIVPVYNPSVDFLRTLDAIRSQEGCNCRIIIVNDGSTNGFDVFESISKYPDIIIHNIIKNKGGGYARNCGLKYVKSEFVSFCDSDDVWSKSKLYNQITFMEKNNLDITHTDIVVKYETNSEERRITTPDLIDLKTFLSTTQLYCSTVCLRNKSIGISKFGTLRKRHPFKFWVGILSTGVISYRTNTVDCFTYYYVRHNSLSSNKFTTAIYTLFAYILYPKNKLQSFVCLFKKLKHISLTKSRILDII